MKPIWLTSLGPAKEPVNALMSSLKTYGLDVQGHFWKNDLPHMSWMTAVAPVVDPKIPFWAILGDSAGFSEPETLYGLSLAALSIQAKKGIHFPIIILQPETNLISAERLPTPLKGAEVMSSADPGIGAKLVAKAHASPKALSVDYHVNIHGNEQIGQWFEVRPETASWPGIIFGVTGAEISFQAAGPAGKLPDKSVLNYPVQGLELNLGETKYTAWATQNELNAQISYYVKVVGFPQSIVFGPYSENEAADFYVLHLK